MFHGCGRQSPSVFSHPDHVTVVVAALFTTHASTECHDRLSCAEPSHQAVPIKVIPERCFARGRGVRPGTSSDLEAALDIRQPETFGAPPAGKWNVAFAVELANWRLANTILSRAKWVSWDLEGRLNSGTRKVCEDS